MYDAQQPPPNEWREPSWWHKPGCLGMSLFGGVSVLLGGSGEDGTTSLSLLALLHPFVLGSAVLIAAAGWAAAVGLCCLFPNRTPSGKEPRVWLLIGGWFAGAVTAEMWIDWLSRHSH